MLTPSNTKSVTHVALGGQNLGYEGGYDYFTFFTTLISLEKCSALDVEEEINMFVRNVGFYIWTWSSVRVNTLPYTFQYFTQFPSCMSEF